MIATDERTSRSVAGEQLQTDAATAPGPAAGLRPLAALADAGLEVPVLGGGTVRHVNLDVAASDRNCSPATERDVRSSVAITAAPRVGRPRAGRSDGLAGRDARRSATAVGSGRLASNLGRGGRRPQPPATREVTLRNIR